MPYNVVDASAVQQIQYVIYTCKGFLGDSVVKKKKSACQIGDWGSIPSWEDPLGKEMATHSSILAWEILWTKECLGLQSMRSQKSQTQLSDQTTMIYIYIYIYPLFLGFTSYLHHHRALSRVPCAIQ